MSVSKSSPTLLPQPGPHGTDNTRPRSNQSRGCSDAYARNGLPYPFELAEPPCVPSRRFSKWRIRLVMYAGIVLCDITHLLLTISYVMRPQRAGCEVLLLPGTNPRQVNHSGSRAPPNRNRLGGRWLLDPTWDVQCPCQSPHRFCDHSRVQ